MGDCANLAPISAPVAQPEAAFQDTETRLDEDLETPRQKEKDASRVNETCQGDTCRDEEEQEQKTHIDADLQHQLLKLSMMSTMVFDKRLDIVGGSVAPTVAPGNRLGNRVVLRSKPRKVRGKRGVPIPCATAV